MSATPLSPEEERAAVERERYWLNEYDGWTSGVFADPPNPVSHPQHVDAVRGWFAARESLAQANARADEATHMALIYKRERKAWKQRAERIAEECRAWREYDDALEPRSGRRTAVAPLGAAARRLRAANQEAENG